MKKRKIFYVLFAFLLMFGLKSNVRAIKYPFLKCVYKKENSNVVWSFTQYDDKGNWRGFKVNGEDGYIENTKSTDDANNVKIERQNSCPQAIYYNTGKGKPKKGWYASSQGGVENKYNLITLNLGSCNYQKEYSNIVWSLTQDYDGIPHLHLKQDSDGKEGEDSTSEKLHFAVRTADDSCPSNIYYLKNYWTQYGSNYDSNNSKHIKYNLIDQNYSPAIKNDSKPSDLFCVYDDSDAEYLLYQTGNDLKAKFKKLGTNENVGFNLISDGKDISTGLIVNCPLNIYLTNDGKYTNTEPSSKDLKKTLNLVKSATCFSSSGFVTGIEVKTEKNYYALENPLFSSLKNYTSFNTNDSIETVCGKDAATGYHVQQTLSSNKDVPTTITCQYAKTTDTPFSITIDTKKKTFSADVSKISFCSGNNTSNPVNTSQITYNDVVNNNLCNENIKLKVEKVSDGFCKIVKSDDGDAADSSTNNEIKDSIKTSYTGVITWGGGSTSFSNSTYTKYTKTVCGIFKADGKLFPIVKNLYKILKIAVPLLVVILTIVEFLKVLFSGEDKTMKDAFKATITRFILIAVLVFLPILIEFIIKLAGLSENCLQQFFK